MKTVFYKVQGILFLLFTICSCTKTYNCRCFETPNKSVDATYSFSERNKSKAIDKCDSYEVINDNPHKKLECGIK